MLASAQDGVVGRQLLVCWLLSRLVHDSNAGQLVASPDNLLLQRLEAHATIGVQDFQVLGLHLLAHQYVHMDPTCTTIGNVSRWAVGSPGA
jgi:hypothetical protein